MAQTQLLKGLSQISVIEETSQDTLLAPTAASIVLVSDDVTVGTEGGPLAYEALRGDYMRMARAGGPQFGTVSFSVPMTGGAAAGTAPGYGEALKACGMLGTNTAVTSEEYTPSSVFDGASGNPGPSYSVHWLNNGSRYSIIGAFGKVSMTAEIDSTPMLKFDFQGAYSPYANDALEDASAVYKASIAPAFLGTTVVMNFGGAYSVLGCTAIDWDMGSTLAMIKDSGAAYGYIGARIIGHKPSGTITLEKRLQDVANFDVQAIAAAGTVGTIATGTIGGTAGSKWAFDVRACTLGPPQEGDSDGIMQWTIPWEAHNLPTATEATVATAAVCLTIT